MKNSLLPLLFLTLFSVVFSADDYSLSDTFQAVIDTENALKEELKNDFLEAKDARQKFQEEAAKRLNETLSRLNDAVQARVKEYEEYAEQKKAQRQEEFQAKIQKWQEFSDKLKAAYDQYQQEQDTKKEEKRQRAQELIDQFKNAYEKRQQEKEQEREQLAQKWKEARDKFKAQQEELRNQLQAAKEKWNEKQKQKLEDLKADLQQLKELIAQEVKRRLDEKKQREQDEQAQLEDLKSQIAAQRDGLQQQAKQVYAEFSEYNNQKDQLANLIKDALDQGVKANIRQQFADKLQKQLDKAALKEVLKEQQQSPYNNGKPLPPAAVVSANAAPRATILDEITGKSAWQTVTWILLALCILLSIALIVVIVYQVKQRSVYERLDGSNAPHHAEQAHSSYQAEKTPLVSAPLVPASEQQF